ERPPRTGQVNHLAGHRDTALALSSAVQRQQQVALALALAAADAQDLACEEIEADLIKAAPNAEVLDFKNQTPIVIVNSGRVKSRLPTSKHFGDDLVIGHASHGVCRDGLAVSEHRHRVGDPSDLL